MLERENRGGVNFVTWIETLEKKWKEKGLQIARAVGNAGHSGWGWKSEGRVCVGEEVQSLFSSTNICAVSSLALRNVLSSSNLWSPSPGVSPHAKYLQGGFVRNCRCWAVGEDCPASPAIRVCAFLCQQTVVLTDVTRKQIRVAQSHFWSETRIPEGRVSINAQGSCSG